MKKQKIAKYFCGLTILLLFTFSFFSLFQINNNLKIHLSQKEYKFSLKDKNSSVFFNENEEIDSDEENGLNLTKSIVPIILFYNYHLFLKTKTKTNNNFTQSKISNHLPTWLEIRHLII
jgi:hypothetical protein